MGFNSGFKGLTETSFLILGTLCNEFKKSPSNFLKSTGLSCVKGGVAVRLQILYSGDDRFHSWPAERMSWPGYAKISCVPPDKFWDCLFHLCCDHLLPDALQFIIHHSSYHQCRIVLLTNSFAKTTTKFSVCPHGADPRVPNRLRWNMVRESSLLYRACCFSLFFIVPTHALLYTLKH